MMPQPKIVEQETQQDQELPQEFFVRQVEDHSLPADEILNDQKEAREPNQPRSLYVP